MEEKYGIELEIIMDKFNAKINRIKQTFTSIKNKEIEINVDGAQIDLLEYKISELEEKLEKAYNGEIHLNTQEIVKTEAQLEKLYNQLDKIEDKEEEIESKGNSCFSSLSKGIGKVTSKIKRFALSLFSIRSIYSLVSKASSAYLSQDTELANKLQATWVRITVRC